MAGAVGRIFDEAGVDLATLVEVDPTLSPLS
jgi:hypothetical protein